MQGSRRSLSLLLLLFAQHGASLVTTTTAPLIAWARGHGARVSDALTIKSTGTSKGLFAVADIAAGTEMIMLPGILQLGVQQLAAGRDTELQALCKSLPESRQTKSLPSLPCGIALCAEVRLGSDSLFHEYISELPINLTCAIAPVVNGFGSVSSCVHDDSKNLALWPAAAAKVAAQRKEVRFLHGDAPLSLQASLSLRDLCWASACASSRAFRVGTPLSLSASEKRLIGSRSASDPTRLLPLIDLANHGSLHNAAVGNIRRTTHRMEGAAPPTATSMISTRNILSGEEILLDYGSSGDVSNERLLIEYGFVLQPHQDDHVCLPLDALNSSMPAGLSTDALLQLAALQNALRGYSIGTPLAGTIQFGVTGAPSLSTLALALAVTCTNQEDLDSLKGPDPTAISLVELVGRCSESQKNRALSTLREVAGAALAAAPIQPTGDGERLRSGRTFEDSACEYYETRREILRCAAAFEGA